MYHWPASSSVESLPSIWRRLSLIHRPKKPQIQFIFRWLHIVLLWCWTQIQIADSTALWCIRLFRWNTRILLLLQCKVDGRLRYKNFSKFWKYNRNVGCEILFGFSVLNSTQVTVERRAVFLEISRKWTCMLCGFSGWDSSVEYFE